MDGDLVFRILLLALFIPGMVTRVYYGRKQQVQGKKRSVRERYRDATHAEGKLRFALLAIEGVYLVIATIIYLLAFPSMLWTQLPLPDWLRWFGFGLGIVSLPFLIWVHHTLGKYWSPSLELKGDHALVTSGPYSRVRHPLYTAQMAYFFALTLVSANLLLLVSFLFIMIFIITRIPKEEKTLPEQFGDEYRAYMKRTGRLLPRFRPEAGEEDPADARKRRFD